ncbi:MULTISPECIES: DUF1415 domain-containing protein [unclassified Oleiphilus]|jgi:hypothetical protein|uniref:DUF1415 domain-containing protein n=1 Tax=unclassified Oleiphilus TaxID=2631174 RepID=UPI0007C3DBD6|nr:MULTISPECIES: DUF1415 domain-containing protein [unclassified Oleiphilus]KZY45676.1 hypothetical protein A3732_01210 [Oleiphilus sp. HI0050]KZY88415.1 hypothetical protein A3741_00025 [Oleiphilus sp. HI0069]KZY93966.1 hypothetical protein A3743_06020 [Oleiphilus sp. HI0072]KZZ09534.1 hypothetical protein A3749_13370 [Oleiphilus sp. HI0078]KZZ20239.1 hypothetical protein A3752_12280 [Oleiphilus sp. HI0081]
MSNELSLGHVESEVVAWLERVVIGLNLCPFARKPYEDERVRIAIDTGSSYDSILERLLAELRFLDNDSNLAIETTLLVIPNGLSDFYSYLACLSDANSILVSEGYEGVFQLASFHPDYQFEGTEPDDKSNLTNRAPYPVFHIIREQSLEYALESYDNPEKIPERNVELMQSMEGERLKALFPWLSI